MIHCMLTILLFIMPVGVAEIDSFGEPAIYGCSNGKGIESIWMEDHALLILTKKERIRIPLPPVKDPMKIQMLFDLQSNRADMGEWGRIYVQRGPKKGI